MCTADLASGRSTASRIHSGSFGALGDLPVRHVDERIYAWIWLLFRAPLSAVGRLSRPARTLATHISKPEHDLTEELLSDHLLTVVLHFSKRLFLSWCDGHYGFGGRLVVDRASSDQDSFVGDLSVRRLGTCHAYVASSNHKPALNQIENSATSLRKFPLFERGARGGVFANALGKFRTPEFAHSR